jgi:signal transduction histidine kinase
VNLRLRVKVFLAFGLVLLPLLGLFLAEFRLEVGRLERSVLDDELVTAEATAVAVDRQFDSGMGLAWAVSLDPRVRSFDPAVLDRYLEELAALDPVVTSVAVFDASGANRGYGRVTAGAASSRFSVGDRDYFRQVMATNAPAVSNLVALRSAHVPGVVVGVPIRDAAGGPVGVVSVAMDASELAREFEAARVRPGQATLLADREGRLAFHTARRSLSSSDADRMRQFGPVVSALAGVPDTIRSYVSPLLGDERLGAFVRTSRYRWVVGVTTPRSVALAPAYSHLRAELVGFGLIMGLTVVLSAFLARLLVQPVLALEDAARAIGRGDLGRRVRIETGDEIERLGTSFNEMADRLQERNEDLLRSQASVSALNLGLEKRVHERTEALESTNRELESFSYSVSHDLRAPLRAVDGFVGIVLEDFRATLPPDAIGYLERARAGARRMSGLIAGLLAFSRAARAPLTRVRIDLGAMAREVCEELRPSGREGVEIHVGELPPCTGDPVLLRQVLSNLIGNALKYSRDSVPARVEVGFEAGSPPTYFVRDSGAGFDMAHADKLFQPFQRLQEAAQFEGSGVGLAIVQRIVTRHGGRVWAESEPGHGATFRFTLGESSAAETAVGPDGALAGVRGWTAQ